MRPAAMLPRAHELADRPLTPTISPHDIARCASACIETGGPTYRGASGVSLSLRTASSANRVERSDVRLATCRKDSS
jgi:hypothetical protein